MRMQDWPYVNRLRRLKSAKGDVGYFEVDAADAMFDGEPVKYSLLFVASLRQSDGYGSSAVVT